MVKRALTLLTSILFALPLLMPFNIYASGYVVTGSDVVIGVNADIYDYDRSAYSQLVQLRSGGSSQWLADSNIGYQESGVFRYEFILNKEYLGYIWIKATFPSGTSQSFKFYVNGDRFYWYTRYNPISNQDMATQFQVTSVSLVEKEDNQMSSEDLTNFLNEIIANQDELIESTAEIYDETIIIGNNTISMNRVLSEFYQYVSVYQKQSLDTINNYLSYISDLRQFNIYPESIPWCIYLINYRYDRLDTISTNKFSISYPVFNLKQNEGIWRNVDLGSNQNQYIHFIFMTYDWIPQTDANTLFKNENLSLVRYDRKNHSKPYFIYHLVYNSSVASNSFVLNRDINSFIPLYVYVDAYPNNNSFFISTEFALQYGLSNKLLDDLDIIANGTVQSNSAASSNDLVNEQLQTDSNTLFTQEDNFKSDMNNAMQNVNNTFRLQDMGTKFVSSAQWVRTQYENLTNNTPFASLITFSLITGLALILLGKVFK